MGVHELQDWDHDVIDAVLERVTARRDGSVVVPGKGERGQIVSSMPLIGLGASTGIAPEVDRGRMFRDRGPVGQLASGVQSLGGTRCASPGEVDPGYRMSRWGRLATTATVLLAGLAVALTVPTDPVPARTVQTTVQAGETLWEVAARVSPAVDPAVVVDRIAGLNPGMSFSPLAGAVLTVPVAG